MDKIVKVLSDGWRFHLGECEDAWYKGYEDSSWRRVIVPHDWSVEAPFSKEYSSGTGYLQGGIGWYRIRFCLPEEYRGKSVRILFDGVYKNSQVWCNSYYLGKRPSGYTSFSYDISSFAVFGAEENEVSVKVTHTDLADSRWFTGSGITRKVTLIIEEPVHLKEYGCFFETLAVERAGESVQARVRVTQEIVNQSGRDISVQTETVFLDADGAQAACLKGGLELEMGAEGKVILEGLMPRAELWSCEQPYLYTMQTWICTEEKGRCLAGEEKVGVRTFCFDADKGFFLNGVSQKLKGVCVHHDGGCLGAAMKAEVWQRRLKLLKESGCNAIRCSHNPHMPELYSLCDAMGFVMMDEAFDEWENAKNKWSVGHNVYPPKHQGYYEDFPAWHEADLRAMVRRDRNHPSVILWSIGNEIDYPNDPYCHPMFDTMTGNNDADKPAAERMYDSDKPNAERLAVIARQLVNIVKEEDTTRPVTLAAAFPELSSRIGFLDALDVVGYNYKEMLYEEDHRRFPAKPILGSENGHSVEAWKAVLDHDYISGQFLWTGIDYLGEAKGWPVHGSPAGFITTAGFAKPELEVRKQIWSMMPGEVIDKNMPAENDFSADNNAGIKDAKATVKARAKELDYVLWREPDLAGGLSFEEASAETGYLYQILLTLRDADGNPVTGEERMIRVQVQGSGELAGLDNGNLADLTPFAENSRETYRGQLAVYVRRCGAGSIHIMLECQSRERAGDTDLGGRRYEISLD